MEQKHKIQIFNEQKVRTVWNEEEEKWYFSIVDVCAVLTDSANPQTYWRVLKKRLKDEGNETVTNCNALKMLSADGKMRLTDVADQQQLMLAEATTAEISKSENPKGFNASAKVAHIGGQIAGETRVKIEAQTGRSIVSREKASDYLPTVDKQQLPESNDDLAQDE